MRFFPAIAGILLVGCGPGEPGTGTSTGSMTSAVRAKITAPVLREHTRALTEIGPRMSGTVEEVEAERVVIERFEAMGLEAVPEPFVWDAWRPGTASIEIDGQTWEIEAHSPSPATELTAPLIAEGEDLTGAIALFSTNTGSRAEHFLRAASSGAAAFLRKNDFVDHDGSPLVEVGHTLEGSTMPGGGVDKFVGRELRDHLGEQATLRIAPDIAVDHTSQNILASVGPEDGDRTIYVVAHYDSWHPSESAFDNALGVGALLAMADRLASGPAPSNRVVFMATAGEEQGLQGAFAWVEEHAAELRPVDVVVTLDVLWSGEGRFSCMATTDELRGLAMDAATEEALNPKDGGQPTPASDHFPFVIEGTDAVWCGRWPDRHYHTVADTLDQLDLAEAAAAARSQFAVVAELAGVAP